MRPYKDKPKQTAMSLLTQVLDKAQKSEIFIKEGIYYEENLTLTRDIITVTIYKKIYPISKQPKHTNRQYT